MDLTQHREQQLKEIVEIINKKINEEITGKIILNFNDGIFCNANFEYSIKRKK